MSGHRAVRWRARWSAAGSAVEGAAALCRPCIALAVQGGELSPGGQALHRGGGSSFGA